ncbi:MAG: LysM peptidoglycan-binding domain-containing protein [Ferruginibacter sp.]|nr:LysM peptidoglycan-binding domain-containing protein [Chitinophagaceae bacterium]
MKQFLLFSCVLTVVALGATAQKKDLMVRSSDKGLYLEHKVAAKESFYAIGRLYNVSPKSIGTFNDLDMSKGLLIGQKLRIPLTDTNFSQQVNSGTPVWYKTGNKEDLTTTSNKHNNVSLENLRFWNNISDDGVKKDTRLIIGFLQSKEMPVITIANKPKAEEPELKTEEKPVEKADEQPVVKVEEPPVVKVEEKPEVKAEEKPVVKLEEKPVVTDQGYFKSNFEQQIKTNPLSKNETVTSGFFITTSGWEDAKYYLLIDRLSPGTIVKIINPSNNKTVYAKVLGEMSGIRQNEGFNIRISNAAASALEINGEDKFIVKVNY